MRNDDYYRQVWRLVSDNRRWIPPVFGLLFYGYIQFASDQMDKAAEASAARSEQQAPKNPWALEE
jgi:hypothetical protein